MPFDMDSLFERDAFTSLGPEKLRLIKKFTRDIDGKAAMEIVKLYIELNRQISITPAERAAVIEAIQESLPAGDRQKFNQILKMIR
jgi:hypothetical protein